jgi:hypothetical protein
MLIYLNPPNIVIISMPPKWSTPISKIHLRQPPKFTYSSLQIILTPACKILSYILSYNISSIYNKPIIRYEVEVERRVLTRYQGDIHDKGDNYSREVIRLLFENSIESDFREIEEYNDMNHDISYEVKNFRSYTGTKSVFDTNSWP